MTAAHCAECMPSASWRVPRGRSRVSVALERPRILPIHSARPPRTSTHSQLAASSEYTLPTPSPSSRLRCRSSRVVCSGGAPTRCGARRVPACSAAMTGVRRPAPCWCRELGSRQATCTYSCRRPPSVPAAAAVLDHHEDVETTQEDGVDVGKVDREDRVGLRGQELAPARAGPHRGGVDTRSLEDRPDGGGGHLVAESETVPGPTVTGDSRSATPAIPVCLHR